MDAFKIPPFPAILLALPCPAIIIIMRLTNDPLEDTRISRAREILDYLDYLEISSARGSAAFERV
jgi:hypothetical protein